MKKWQTRAEKKKVSAKNGVVEGTMRQNLENTILKDKMLSIKAHFQSGLILKNQSPHTKQYGASETTDVILKKERWATQ